MAAGKYNNKTPIDERIKDLEAKAKDIADRISRLKEVKKIHKELPFKEGDVAFHAEYGNILVKSIQFGPPESDFEIKYIVVDMNAKTHTVEWKTLLPITEATKALYGKGN